MMKQIKMLLAKIWRLGRATATAMGVAVLLAVVLGVATTALATVPGDPFKLGKTNTTNNLSTLVGSASGTLLRINNNGGGPALDLRVEEGKAPMNVNSSTKVIGLNADQLDDHGANDFLSEDKTYTTSELEFGHGGGTYVEAYAECDPRDRILGGGGGTPGIDSDFMLASEPFDGDGWRVIVQDNGDDNGIFARAICADFPPLR